MPYARSLSRLGSKALGFGLVPAVSLVTPLLVIPIVSRRTGADGILAVSVGQSVGAVAGIVVGLGWPLVGAAMIARAEDSERRRLYELSLQSRLLVLVAILPISTVCAYFLVAEERETAVLMAATFSGYGLTSIWYYVGTGRPRGLLVLEVLPRIVAAVAAAALLAAGAPLIVYPLLLLSAVGASFVMNARNVFGALPKVEVRAAWRGIRSQRRASISRAVNSLYNGGATSLVAAVSPNNALLFAAMDRIHRSLFNGLSTLPDAMVAWVVGDDKEGRAQRVHAAMLGDLFLALLSAGVVYLMLPHVAVFLYSDLIVLPPSIRALSAAAIASLVLARAFLDHGVLALGYERAAANVLVVGSLVGAAGLVIGAVTAGVAGAITAVIVAEIVVIVGALAASRPSGRVRLNRADKDVVEAGTDEP